jgi:DNA-binding PadR family transcriptional regulator
MEERLKRLRKAMDGGTFQRMPFTKDKNQMIKRGIENSRRNDQDILLHILQLLLKEKSGHELLKQLRARGIKKYEERQGFLYSNLHKLEQDRILESSWEEGTKLYRISNRGRKLLQQIEEGNHKNMHSFKALPEGGIADE